MRAKIKPKTLASKTFNWNWSVATTIMSFSLRELGAGKMFVVPVYLSLSIVSKYFGQFSSCKSPDTVEIFAT